MLMTHLDIVVYSWCTRLLHCEFTV